MNTKEFKISDALLSLRPGAQWTHYGGGYEDLVWHELPVEEGGQEMPTLEEIEIELERLQQEWENNEYQRLRKNDYPSIEEQLDLLYHQGYEGWKSKIEEVKLNYPKFK